MRTKRFVLANTFVAVLLMSLSLILAACGSDNTPTTSTTVSTTSTTSATTTTSNSISNSSTNPTVSAATPAGTSSATNLPAIQGATAINVDQSVIAAATGTLPGVTNPTFQILSSGDTADNFTTAINKAFINAGYKFAFPNATQPVKQGDNTVALYTKSGSPDVLISTYSVPTDVNVLSRNILPGLQADAAQKLLDELKNQKSIALVLTASNLTQFLGAEAGLTPPTGGIPTVVATPAVTGSATTAPPVNENDLPVYANSTKAVGPTTVGDTFSVSYVTSDSYDNVVTWSKTAYTAKGWQGITTNEQAGATIFTGRKGSSTLIATILGPQARSNAGFANFFSQANAGPNDTVIVVVVTY